MRVIDALLNTYDLLLNICDLLLQESDSWAWLAERYATRVLLSVDITMRDIAVRRPTHGVQLLPQGWHGDHL